MGRGWTGRFCSLRDGPQLSSVFGAGRLLRCPWALAPELSMMSCPLWAGPAGSRAILGPAPTRTRPHSHRQGSGGEQRRSWAQLGVTRSMDPASWPNSRSAPWAPHPALWEVRGLWHPIPEHMPGWLGPSRCSGW